MLAPVIAGFGQGLTSNAWMNLMIVTIPGNRRSSLLAVRNGVSAAAGVGVGYLVKLILARYPGSDGYAVLHLLTSLCVAISLGFFLLARDPPHQPRPFPEGGMLRSWARMAAALVHDRQFRRFLMGNIFQCGTFVLIPFLAINALEVLQRPQSYLGQLLMLQTSGAIAGNIVAGFVGDRFGGKTAILAGMLVFIGLAAGSAMASTDIETSAVFLLLGFAFPMIGVGGFTMGTELCPEGNRPAYLALLAMVGMPGMLLASVASSTMWSWGLGIWPLAVTTMSSLGLSIALLLPIRERRQRDST
jgi:MFS-type transporter involved in bile tolerance (Atg22 family)